MLSRLGKHLVDSPVHPQALLDAVAAYGPLARALEDFLTASKLALPSDHNERSAAARRQSRINAVPEPLRPAVAGFAEHLVAGRDRARRAGTHPRGHATLEARLTALRDFAQFLIAYRGKTDWATVDVGDIEAFLHAHSRPTRLLPDRAAPVLPLRSASPADADRPHRRSGSTADHGISRSDPARRPAA
jgi:hypothetical protein